MVSMQTEEFRAEMERETEVSERPTTTRERYPHSKFREVEMLPAQCTNYRSDITFDGK